MVGDIRFLAAATPDDFASLIYADAKCDPERPPGGYALVMQLGGTVGIYRGWRIRRGDPELVATDDNWSVLVHPDLPMPMANLALARGVCLWYRRRLFGQIGVAIDDLAMALLLPRAVAQRAVAESGFTAHEIAERYVLPIPNTESRLRQVLYKSHRSGTYVRTW